MLSVGALGFAIAEVFERVVNYPSLEKEFRKQLEILMDKYNNLLNELNVKSKELMDAQATLENKQKELVKVKTVIELVNELEYRSAIILTKYEDELDDVIDSLQNTVETYKVLLGDTHVEFKEKVIDVLLNLKNTKLELEKTSATLLLKEEENTRLKKQIEDLESRINKMMGSLQELILKSRELRPELFFGANMRVGLDTFSLGKSWDDVVLQLTASYAMNLNCLRIVIDPWLFASQYHRLSDDARQKITFIINKISNTGAKLLITFDKVMWLNSNSTSYWIGYNQYKEAILDVVRLLRYNPTIVAYDLSNEPVLAVELARLEEKITAEQADNWVKELQEVYELMAADIRAIDDNVLVTIGEAFPEHVMYFKDIVDFVSFHDTGMWSPYPEKNTWNGTAEDLRDRFRDRVEVVKSYGKPVVLEEYGLDPNYVNEVQKRKLGYIKYQPIDFYQVLLDEVMKSDIGALFWVINIKADDRWNLAVNNSGELTNIGKLVREYSLIRISRRLQSQ